MELFFNSYNFTGGADAQVDVDAHIGIDAFQASLEGRPPIIIIPGLFGSTSNWRGFARKVAASYPVIVIDQRNHGRSPHGNSQTYADMVADLYAFIQSNDWNRVVLCGHSMGGKTAMMFSLLHPEYVSKLAVLDIAPVEYAHSHAPFLEALLSIDLSQLASRGEADRALQQAIPETGTRLFLLQSLTGSAGSYRWRLNLPVLHEYMHEIIGFPQDQLAGYSSNIDACFIFGEASDYVQATHHKTIEGYFPCAEFVGIPGAGHWLHVEQPKPVIEALLNFVLNGENND